jgi:hypothetical protein
MSLTPEQEQWVSAMEACVSRKRDVFAAALIRTQAARIEALERELQGMIDAYWRGFEDSEDEDAPQCVKAALASLTKDPDQ